MTIENILKKIETETKTEVNKILKEIQNETNIIKTEAKKELDAKLNQVKEQGKKRIEIMRNIHLSEARRAARRITLSAKEELIEECFTQAKERLKGLTGEEYRNVMAGLVKESLTLVGDRGVATLTRENDKAILSSFSNITLKSKLAQGLGGLIMESTDGKIVVDNTFDAILERQKDDIRTEVAKILYPEE